MGAYSPWSRDELYEILMPVKRCLSSYALAGLSALTAVTLLYAQPRPGLDSVRNRMPRTGRKTQLVHAFGARTARELIGRRVEARTGDHIGRVNDMVINARTGEVMFVVLASGGFAGVGVQLKPVPPKALTQGWAKRGVLTVDINPRHWEAAPRMNKERLKTLGDPLVASTIYAFYHQPWRNEKNVLAATHSDDSPQPVLKLASELMGESVLNPQQGEIGRVSDLAVDLKNPNSSGAIIATVDAHNKRFLIPFDHFENAFDGNALLLNTGLRGFQVYQRADIMTQMQKGRGT